MKIVSTSREIKNILTDSIKKYQNIRFAVAWASSNHDVFKKLYQHKNKIINSTVGLHFYQTHPDFIENFLDSQDVQFIKNKKGVFHPKIYFFYNNQKNWACLIGSTNFTHSALTDNDEIMTFIESDNSDLFENITQILDTYFQKAFPFKLEDLQGYKNIWEQKKKDKTYNDDNFKAKGQIKPLYMSEILSFNWNDYYAKLSLGNHFPERLNLLDKSSQYFSNNSFKNMTEEQRKNIAGINKLSDGIRDWRLFGGMNMARLFVHRVNDKKKEISESLDYISINSAISRDDYLSYIKYFKKASGWGYGISTTSRLLAMKRPDTFFCLTLANEIQLMNKFGIIQSIASLKDYERYWDEIIEPVRQSPWFKSEMPSDKQELRVWHKRVAMMDALFYNE